MTPEAQGAVERAAEVLSDDGPPNDRLLAMVRKSLVMTRPMTEVDAICETLQRRLATPPTTEECTCGEAWRGHPNPHAITCPSHLLATPPTASHDETALAVDRLIKATGALRRGSDGEVVGTVTVPDLRRILAARAAAGAGASELGGES